MVILGALFTFLAIAYSTTRAATQGSSIGTHSGQIQLDDAEQGEDHTLITTEPSERRRMRAEALRAAVEAGYRNPNPSGFLFFFFFCFGLMKLICSVLFRLLRWKNPTMKIASTRGPLGQKMPATETTNVDPYNTNTRHSTLSFSLPRVIQHVY